MLFIFFPSIHSHHMIQAETATVFSQAFFPFGAIYSLLFTILQIHSGWKGAQEVFGLTCCSEEGQAWGQTRLLKVIGLLRALAGEVLKSLQRQRWHSLSGQPLPWVMSPQWHFFSLIKSQNLFCFILWPLLLVLWLCTPIKSLSLSPQ